MKVNITPDDLINFEKEVCKNFSQKKILAPVHLDNGNEDQLIEVFSKYVDEEDWVFGSWRQHYKCLLKGVPQNELMQAILQGKSIGLCFPQYKVISSAIVGGIIPIALGIALGIKMNNGTNKAVCFLGEMTSESGIFHECLKYSENHSLPILWVIEDNNKSVCTITSEVWKKMSFEPENYQDKSVVRIRENVLYYKYQSLFPHAGCGERIQF